VDLSVLTQLGVGGIFALMILDRVFVFLNKKKNGKICADNNIPEITRIIHAWDEKIWDHFLKQERLFEMHTRVDDDGVPLWYRRKSLDEAMLKLAENIEVQTGVLKSLIEGQREIKELMK